MVWHGEHGHVMLVLREDLRPWPIVKGPVYGAWKPAWVSTDLPASEST
jgi:hypothetical protein